MHKNPRCIGFIFRAVCPHRPASRASGVPEGSVAVFLVTHPSRRTTYGWMARWGASRTYASGHQGQAAVSYHRRGPPNKGPQLEPPRRCTIRRMGCAPRRFRGSNTGGVRAGKPRAQRMAMGSRADVWVELETSTRRIVGLSERDGPPRKSQWAQNGGLRVCVWEIGHEEGRGCELGRLHSSFSFVRKK